MFPKSIAELFGKEEKPTDKQKRQVTTCLFAMMSRSNEEWKGWDLQGATRHNFRRMEVSCREEKCFIHLKAKDGELLEMLKNSWKAVHPLRSRRSAELFGKEEKPTGKQKRQVTTCLFAMMSGFDDGAYLRTWKERQSRDGIAIAAEKAADRVTLFHLSG